MCYVFCELHPYLSLQLRIRFRPTVLGHAAVAAANIADIYAVAVTTAFTADVLIHALIHAMPGVLAAYRC
ncbi:Hypothetical predicted protein [Octopus vulgaris]|uniref:Uncharacterized protein n=1 Tax=Octopus vulgaris TaxID=6645 RepID=A0AA36AKA1_OCTVU|nr:Hypothetical predicted protein [Octopus vulgaris]